MTIVVTHYRYKRPPPKRKAVTVALAKAVPAVVTSTVVTVRRSGRRVAEALDVTPEEQRQRGEAADELFRELSARAGRKDRR